MSLSDELKKELINQLKPILENIEEYKDQPFQPKDKFVDSSYKITGLVSILFTLPIPENVKQASFNLVKKFAFLSGTEFTKKFAIHPALEAGSEAIKQLLAQN